MRKVLILGGYGSFGKRIAEGLTRKGIPVIIAGRNREKAEALAQALSAESAVFDVNIAGKALAQHLADMNPAVVINASGPFQGSDYHIARACIAHGMHYIDLADARDFVTGITELDKVARVNNVAVISGASTVPGLSSAVLEHYREGFSTIESVKYGISPGQRAQRGLATTQSVLSYVGKPLKPFAGKQHAYGWQDIYRQEYPVLGKRWMANCDIPDLDLLPQKYGLKSIQFSAGMEMGFIHLGIWLLSWLVRFGLISDLPGHASLLLRISNMFNIAGTANGGMHMIIRGRNEAGRVCTRYWFVVARGGDGPQIPCVPAIVLAAKLAAGMAVEAGAYPCVARVTLEEYMQELGDFDIAQVSYLE